MNSVVTPFPSFTQTGSAFILMTSGVGAVPSSLTVPVIVAAVAGSIVAVAAGAAPPPAGAASLLPPPHATAVMARANMGTARPFNVRGDIQYLLTAESAVGEERKPITNITE